MDEFIGSLDDAQVFSTIDANRAHFQIEVESFDGEETAFTFDRVLLQLTSMPFGLKNASPSSQRVKDNILSSVK